MNKKGVVGFVLAIFLTSVLIISVSGYYLFIFPKIKTECNTDNFIKYPIADCLNYYNGIEICESINATWIRTEAHFFGSDEYICKKGEEIIRV